MPILTGQLLQTKLQRPRVARNFLPRPRLVRRLNQSLHSPLTLVSAAAGYGKTTLVTSWLEGLAPDAAIPAAWISLDENDSHLQIFLRYFIAGLRMMFAGACTATLELLQARQRPPLDLVLATLSNEIAGLPRDFVLVLDDYQAVGGTEVPQLFGDFLRHWPQPMHLVLISRHDPTLPLAGLRARGQLTEIRTRELRFTPAEAADYLNQALPGRFDGPAGDVLERHLEGWIAGLQLASLSLSSAEDPEAVLAGLAGIETDFAGYLMGEVLVHQPGPVLDFLLQTAVLDHFCAPLCEAVICDEDPEWNTKRCIDWLERTNMFIVPLDGQREWYRYHQILGSVLRRRAMAELGPECLTGLQRRAAVWFAEHGMIEEALRYAQAANDLHLVAELIEQGLRDVLNREDRPTLERWLRLLPEELVQARPGLLMAKAWSLQFSWQLGAQAKLLRRINALLEQGGGATLAADQLQILRAQLAELMGQEAYFNNRYAHATACLEETLALAPEPWLYVRSGSMLYLAASLQASGQGQAAERLLIENYQSLGDKTSTYGLRLLLALCFVYYAEAEDLERVRRTAQRMMEEAERSGLALLRSWGPYFLGLVHYQRNELTAAQEQLAKLLNSQYTAQLGALRDGALRLAQIQQSLGQAAEAAQTADFLVRLDLDQMGRESDETAALRACLRMMQGDIEGAGRWADAFNGSVPDRALPFQFSPHKIKARILLARGTTADIQAALQVLAALDGIAERSHNMRLKIEVLALNALALRAAGQAAEALAALRRAVELARPGGFLRPFVNLGPPMYRALSELAGLDRANTAHTVRSILDAFPAQDTGQQPMSPLPSVTPAAPAAAAGVSIGAQTLIEPLTARELEVLALMREPLSAKEIARRLHISYQTVRRHSANIFGKLDVNKRWAAVAKAEALRLLPPR